MKQRRPPVFIVPVLLLLLFAAWPPGSAWAKKVTPKPVVLLLLDSSGSMESSVSELDQEGIVPICHDSENTSFDYDKSRWVVAAEVLTGSFIDYWCTYDMRDDDATREDYLYSFNEELGVVELPHVMPQATEVDGSDQRHDGLLDLYRDQIKFGLMTFDVKLNPGADIAGGFSYGEHGAMDGTPINWGARNEDATWGALVSPPKGDGLDAIRNANAEIQQQILMSKPYGGTPIAPMLEDALEFFDTDERVKPYNDVSGEGDPYFDCRSKNIILVTDGAPNLGEGQYGYLHSHQAAKTLYARGITVHVVGFQMPPSSFSLLDKIALAGSGGDYGARRVESQAELLHDLGKILVEIQGNTPARTGTTISNRTMNSDHKQYQFNASFSGTSVSPLDQVGQLDQLIYRCDPSCVAEGEDENGASLCEVYSISDALNERTSERTIWTQLNGTLESFTNNTNITADVLDIPTEGELPQLDPYIEAGGLMVFSGVPLGDAGVESNRDEYAEQLVRLVAGEEGSRRETIRMGAIYHSDPVMQPNLYTVTSPIPSFSAYRAQWDILTRPSVLFVGTHDGQMHAFRVDRKDDLLDTEYGMELWSFIPKHLLKKLDNLSMGMDYLMDASPVVQEVRMLRSSAIVTIEDEIDQWKSVLMAGYRGGGRGYFAMDVTDPVAPSIMWEVSDTERCFNPEIGVPTCLDTDDFARLGFSYSTPAVGAIFLNDVGGYQERAVAIFGGGQSDPTDLRDTDCDCPGNKIAVMHVPPGNPENAHKLCIPEPDLKAHLKNGYIICQGGISDAGSGRAVFVVDLATGAVLKEFCNDCSNVEDSSDATNNVPGLDCPMTGAVAAHDAYIGGIITRAFIGDDCGQLWRLDLSDTDPNNWSLKFFHDAYADLAIDSTARRAISIKPSMAVGRARGQVMLVYGTGDSDDPLGVGEADRVYSVSEEWDGDGFDAVTNWELFLEAEETFSSSAVVFDEVAYFTTQTAGGGLCDLGVGRLWGLDYDGNVAVPEATDDIIGALDQDGEPHTLDFVEYLEYENSELLGVQVVQRPGCFSSPSEYEPWNDGVRSGSSPPPSGGLFPGFGPGGGLMFGGASSGNLEVVVQTGESGVSSPGMTPPEGGGMIKTGNKAAQKLTRPAQSVFSTSWGLVFD